jgi:uncharacterized membrane protein YgdD (TMEM256/DUF423 family)
MDRKITLAAGSILGFLAVALGAFGAHALKEVLESAGRVDTFELGVRYQFFHALTLLFVGLWRDRHDSRALGLSSLFLVLGVILFSGSLYALSLTTLKFVVFLTPLGGVCFLIAWGLLAYGILRGK